MLKFSQILLALSIALLLPTGVWADSGVASSGKVELGVTGVGIDDDKARVSEYTDSRSEDGVNANGEIDLSLANSDGMALDLTADINGGRDAKVEAVLDLHRAVKINLDYTALRHQLDHDQLNYLDAAVVRGGMNKTTHEPVPLTEVNPDLVPAFVLVDGATNTVIYGSDTGDFSSVADGVDDYVVQTGGASLYGEDLTPGDEFAITWREWKAGTELTIPSVPNLTFDVSFRKEHREGTEQSITNSKCSSCHVTGQSREVDETTEDLKAGVTGKFGLLTLRYEFTDRKFDNDAGDPSVNYDNVMKPGQPFDNKVFNDRMTYDYDDGSLKADTTPESEKQAHLIKARVDLANDTTVVGSYVNSEVESDKGDEPGIFTINRSTLVTNYDGYGLKATTRFGKLKLSAYGKLEEVESDSVDVEFQTKTAPTSPSAGATYNDSNTGFYSSTNESALSRDVFNAGVDVMYRLAKRSTLRLGYEYESEDREDEHFGETETNTFKAKLSMRPVKGISVRAGYTYQDIDNPFGKSHGALVEVGDTRLQAKFGVPGYLVGGNSDLYGTQFYAEREADLSNQPDEVHEAKLSTTWAPSPYFSATLTYRFKGEENDLNRSTWEQNTHSPGLSMWYAPNQKFALTASYNYFDQRSETAFCQGFYDG